MHCGSARMEKLSEQIRKSILNSGVSPYVLAKSAGISKSVLSRFLNSGSGLTLKSLDALAEVLGLQVVSTVQQTPRPQKRGRTAKKEMQVITATRKPSSYWRDLAKYMAKQFCSRGHSSRRPGITSGISRKFRIRVDHK